MSPFLEDGDYIVTRRRQPRTGDVVVFEHPHKPGFHLIKRVIGLAGQRVEISGGIVSVDGRAELDPQSAENTRPDGRWQVPEGHVFVLGDARHRSADDGRRLGPVFVGSRADVAVARYWPPTRIGRI